MILLGSLKNVELSIFQLASECGIYNNYMHMIISYIIVIICVFPTITMAGSAWGIWAHFPFPFFIAGANELLGQNHK